MEVPPEYFRDYPRCQYLVSLSELQAFVAAGEACVDPQPPDAISIAEAAQLAGSSSTTIRHRIASGRLQGYASDWRMFDDGPRGWAMTVSRAEMEQLVREEHEAGKP